MTFKLKKPASYMKHKKAIDTNVQQVRKKINDEKAWKKSVKAKHKRARKAKRIKSFIQAELKEAGSSKKLVSRRGDKGLAHKAGKVVRRHKRITAKQRTARQRNIVIARASKKRR